MPNKENKDSDKAGAGDDGNQNKKPVDSGSDKSRPLSTDDVNAISATVMEMQKQAIGDLITQTVGSQLGADSDFRKGIATEITGAVTRMTRDAAKGQKADKDKTADGDITQEAILNASVQLPDGKSMTVADVVQANITHREDAQKRDNEDRVRIQESKLLVIKNELTSRNFEPGSLNLVAEGLAKIVKQDSMGGYIAENVQMPNPLPNSDVPFLTKTISLGDYLDMQAKNMPHLIKHSAKVGTGGKGEGGGDGDNDAEFTAEKALKNPVLYQKWLEKDQDGCLKACEAYQKTLTTHR